MHKVAKIILIRPKWHRIFIKCYISGGDTGREKNIIYMPGKCTILIAMTYTTQARTSLIRQHATQPLVSRTVSSLSNSGPAAWPPPPPPRLRHPRWRGRQRRRSLCSGPEWRRVPGPAGGGPTTTGNSGHQRARGETTWRISRLPTCSLHAS